METYSPHFIPAPSSVLPLLQRSEDQELLARAARDDSRAFDLLFERYRDGLQGFLYRKLHSHDEVEDALSLTFYNAWRGRAMFRGEASGKAWLYQIATRVAIDMLRTRKRRAGEQEWDPEAAELLPPLQAEATEPEEVVLHEQNTGELRRSVNLALEQLTSDERQLVRLFYFDEVSYEEISLRLGISRSQVRGRLHRIRSRMRKVLELSR